MALLEAEEDKKSPFWDWFIGIGLLVLVGGFTLYYQVQKRSTQERFRSADKLYEAGDYTGAAAAYESLKDASYLTAANDSTIYARLEVIEDLQEREKEAVARLRMRIAAGDLDGARAELEAFTSSGLLAAGDRAWLDSVRAALTAP